MSTVSSVNTATVSWDELKELYKSGQIDSSNMSNISVFEASADSSACTDGEDDGKIGFFEAAGSIIKGAGKALVNGIKGMFTDEEGNFSLGQTLKSAATVAACFIPGVGPVIGGVLAAKGIVSGATGLVSGISSAVSATTDAEKKAAFESIGGSGLQLGVSVVGAKAAVKGISGQANAITGSSSYANATSLTGKVAGLADDVIRTCKGYYGSSWSSASGIVGKVSAVAKKGIQGTGENIASAAKATTEKLKEKYDSAKSKASDVADKVKSKASDAADKVKSKAQEAVDSAKAKAQKAASGTEGGKTAETTTSNEAAAESASQSQSGTTSNSTATRTSTINGEPVEIYENIDANGNGYITAKSQATGKTATAKVVNGVVQEAQEVISLGDGSSNLPATTGTNQLSEVTTTGTSQTATATAANEAGAAAEAAAETAQSAAKTNVFQTLKNGATALKNGASSTLSFLENSPVTSATLSYALQQGNEELQDNLENANTEYVTFDYTDDSSTNYGTSTTSTSDAIEGLESYHPITEDELNHYVSNIYKDISKTK